MKRWLPGAMGLALGLVLQPLSAHPSAAQPVADFYRGKTVNIVVGFTAGGNYDLYARLLGEFMGRHIPGNPQMLVQNRPGAGSLNAAKYVIDVAPNDGLTIGLTANALPLDQLLEGDKASVDMKKVRWLGNLVELTSAVTLWHTAPAKTLAEMKTTDVVFGSTGPSGETYMVPIIINALVGTRIKMVTGYPGINEVMLAMERGEIQGRSGSWSNVQQRPDWIKEKKIVPLLQIGMRKHPDMAALPLLSEIVTAAEDKPIADLISATVALSRAPWVAPGVPEDRVKALRAAFDAAVTDAEFVRTAAARNMELSPSPGDEVEKQLRRVLDVKPDVAQKMRTILAAPAK